VRPEQLGDAIREAGGEPGAHWPAVGDGAARYRSELEGAGWAVPDEASPLHVVDARAVCELAHGAPAAARYEELVPDYRRRADAHGVRGAGAADRPVVELRGSAP